MTEAAAGATLGAMLVGGGAIGVGGAGAGLLSIMGFTDIDGVLMGSVSTGVGATGALVLEGATSGSFGLDEAGGNMLRITEEGACAAVSDSGGGGGGIGTGGARELAIVVEATSGLTEVKVLGDDEVLDVELLLFAEVEAAVPPLLFTLVQRRPRKVVILDSIRSAVP